MCVHSCAGWVARYNPCFCDKCCHAALQRQALFFFFGEFEILAKFCNNSYEKKGLEFLSLEFALACEVHLVTKALAPCPSSFRRVATPRGCSCISLGRVMSLIKVRFPSSSLPTGDRRLDVAQINGPGDMGTTVGQRKHAAPTIHELPSYR